MDNSGRGPLGRNRTTEKASKNFKCFVRGLFTWPIQDDQINMAKIGEHDQKIDKFHLYLILGSQNFQFSVFFPGMAGNIGEIHLQGEVNQFDWPITCCVFRPANRCSTRRLLVKIILKKHLNTRRPLFDMFFLLFFALSFLFSVCDWKDEKLVLTPKNDFRNGVRGIYLLVEKHNTNSLYFLS